MPALWDSRVVTPYRKRPPGSACGASGYPVLSSPCARSKVVTCDGVPPKAGTWKMPTSLFKNRMRPSLDHDPPQYTPVTSQIFDIVCRDRSTRFKTPPAEKAMDPLSGDQNGRSAPSLPGIS